MNFPHSVNKWISWLCLSAILIGASGCVELGELKRPQTSPFYGEVAQPKAGEFRWANGAPPKTFDPAFAASPSEMHVVRAVFDGLTEWDAKTLEAVPALAESWENTADDRTWTFRLRSSAAWSNGEKIVADDFVRSWKRLAELGDKFPHAKLLTNIAGMQNVQRKTLDENISAEVDKQDWQDKTQNFENKNLELEATTRDASSATPNSDSWFGVEAVDDSTLRVRLIEPDKDFPQLLAHSSLRPIYGDGSDLAKLEIAKIVTSGAFKLLSNDKSGVLLERSKTYWNASAVKLERVRFVPIENAESALAAYRANQVDAVTNVRFEPLALKLLASYKDFQRAAFNAVTFYEFNRARAPFNDRRVREALAIALDRELLASDELDDAGFPARKFLPQSNTESLHFNVERARALLAEAGFANGKDFPKIKLLINRNDAQRRLARAIAAQWHKNLNVETEIVTSSLNELTEASATSDFDLVRRVVVLPVPNEIVNFQAMFKRNVETNENLVERKSSAGVSIENQPEAANNPALPLPALEPMEDAPLIVKPNSNENWLTQPATPLEQSNQTETAKTDLNVIETPTNFPILFEAQAVEEIPAIPLYFPVSYSLVKPYVSGFDLNLLEAPALKRVEIQSDWSAGE